MDKNKHNMHANKNKSPVAKPLLRSPIQVCYIKHLNIAIKHIVIFIIITKLGNAFHSF